MITAFLFAYLLVGLVLAALVVFDVFGDPDELEVATPLHRLVVFFLAPWLLFLFAFQYLFADDDEESFGDYFFTLFAFVWFGEEEDNYDAD